MSKKKRKDNIEFEVGLDGTIREQQPTNLKEEKIEFEVGLDGKINKVNSKENEINYYPKKKQKEKKSLLEKAGDFGYSTLKTAGNIATNMGEGALRTLEGGLDFLNSASDFVNNPLQEKAEVLTGKLTKDEAKKNRQKKEKKQREFIKKDLTNEFQEYVGFNDIRDNWEKGSIVKKDNLGGQVAQGVGGMVPALLTGNMAGKALGTTGKLASVSTKGLPLGQKVATTVKNAGKATLMNVAPNTVLATSSYGQGLQEAYQSGASGDEARKYALGTSATELATEWITGGIPGIESTGFLDKGAGKLINKATGKVNNKLVKSVAKTILNAGYEAVGEGLEEGLSEIISPLLKNATYSKNEKINWSDVFNSAIVGGITGGILNVPSNIAELKSNISESKTKVEPTLPMGIKPSLDNSANKIQGNPLIENNMQPMMPLDINTVQNRDNQLIQQNQSATKSNLFDSENILGNYQNNLNTTNIVENQGINDISQLNNIQDTSNTSDIYQYKESHNPKIDNLRKSASQYLNNSNVTNSFIETAEKVINDKGYNIVLDDSLTSKNGNIVNAQIKNLENGETEIRINPNSERAGEFLLIHEITHAIETKDMIDLVTDYASKKQEFNSVLESLKETYGTDEVSSEILADISGQLLGNQEFITSLSINKPNIFKRIYNSIISLANKITGNSREALFMKDLGNKWRIAYSRQNNKQLLDTKYMVTGIKGTKNISKELKTNELIDNYKEALELNKKGQSKSKIRKRTGWYKDINNDWKFEISDKEAKIKIDPTPNTSYKLSELMKHDTLYKMYQNIGDTSVKFLNIEDKIQNGKKIVVYGYVNKLTGKVYVNNKIINNKSKVLETLLHETQHKIQSKEGFQTGTYIGKDKNRYNNNFGEMEARETSKRKNMSFEERIEKPSFTSIYNGTNSNEKIYTKEDNKWYTIFGGNASENFEGNNKPSKGIVRETIHNTLNEKGLNNGSFSMVDFNNSWQEHLEKNYKAKGTKTYFEDMIKKESKNIEQDLYTKKVNKVQDKAATLKKKEQKRMTKEAAKILQFSDYQTKQKFQSLISEYYDKPDYNKIRNDILENFSEQKREYINKELKEVKNNIRSTELKVDDDVKKSIADYTFFRKSNYNKLKLKNEGQSVDSFYKKLSEAYPTIFKKEITSEIDQLHRLSEFMNESEVSIDKYKMDEKAVNEATDFIYNSLKNKTNIDELINSISISAKEIKREKTIQQREQASDFVKNSFNWKDKKSGLAYKVNTMKRNFYDIMDKKDANRLYKNYIEPIFKHTAEMQKDIDSYNKKIEKLKLNNKESIAVQMLGEYKYNPETLVTGPQIDEFIEKNKLNYDRLSNAVEIFRDTYDELFERVNATLKEQGYEEIDYRKGYFPHFVDVKPTSKVGKLAEKLGWKFKDNDIPTSIAGITETFKPGKVWTSFSQERKGKVTDYNALKGFDNYIRGAMQDIYFTEDIQKLRALENEIRYQHSDKGIQAKIDELYDDASLSFEDRQDKIEKIYATYFTPLNNFVSELRDYTNGLANKKSGLDRTAEALSNRKFYNVMENVSSRLSANMVGLNLSSAITNFIPIAQATSQVKSKYLLKGLKEAIKNQYSNDGFDNKSVFLTSRLNEADKLYKTKLEKFSEKANFMFEGIDSITSNTIVRGKYYENMANGMSEFNAIRNADEFARDLMAGRTKGEMPTAFNSKNPIVKMFTAFQLEVNNQFAYMAKDLPRDLGDEAKNKLVGAFIKMFLGAWVYNQLTEKVVGRKAAFSPIDTIKEIYDTATNDNLKITGKSTNILENLTQDIPFVGGLIGGGRLPISSAANPLKILKGESTLKDETKKAVFFTILPFGGGQLKKSIEGASMYLNSKEIKGSYNSKGKLRFEAKKDSLSVTQNILFGQSSGESAREYFNNGYAPIDKNTLEKIKKQNISVDEYRKYQSDYKPVSKIKSDKNEEGKAISGSSSGKKAYLIMNSSFSTKEKNYMLSKLSTTEDYPKVEDLKKLANDKKIYKLYYSMSNDNRKTFINELKEYHLSSEELYDYYSTRKKYNNEYTSSFAKEKMMDYLQSANYNEKTKWYLYSKDYGSNSLDLIVNNFNIKTTDYFNTIKYANNIKYQYSNKNQSNIRKQKIFDYIDSLKLSAVNKTILFNQVGYSTASSKDSIFNYIDNLKISKNEKTKIWKALYG